jgi:acetyl esterase/lipase
VIVSVDYRHGPEDRFPAAVDDALAAMHWVSENAEKLGGRDRRVVVAGWSAGGNLAAVVAQMTRDERDIELSGQLLLCPVVDFDFDRPSYQENGEDFLLTTALMNWFSNNYVAESQRKDPRAAPLLGSLTGLPPAVIMTAEFDPLRDGGIAYGDALRDAGVFVVHLSARGQTHTSFTMVDLVLSGAAVREDVADALRVLTSTVLAPPSALYGSEQC